MKRRGFTLIELMVVIAIIIILAAIAIPNYLNMTARAKKSRVASDMNAMATALEAYKTDWGFYPKTTAAAAVAVDDTSAILYQELAGDTAFQGATGLMNKAGNYNAVGEQGPVSYLKAGTLVGIKNPLNTNTTGGPTGATDASHIYYISTSTGAGWALYAVDNQATPHFWITRDSLTSISDAGTTAPTVP
jgi:prepilin-type N-terminal cleavage/methylation domain-containing protein